MSMRCLKPANLDRMSFRAGPLCAGWVNSLLRLAGARDNHTLPFAFITKTKLLTILTSHSYPMVLLFVVFATCLGHLWVAPVIHMPPSWVRPGMGGWPITHILDVPLRHPIPVSTLLNSLWIFCAFNLLASWSASKFALDLKLSDRFGLLLMRPMLSDLQSSPVHVLQLKVVVGFIVCDSNFLACCCPSTTSHLSFNMLSNSISSVLNSAGSLPSNTKNLHLATSSLYLNSTEKLLTILFLNCCILMLFCYVLDA